MCAAKVALLACVACGRVRFDAIDAVPPGFCTTATFQFQPASSFVDDFSSGVLTDRWTPVDPCITETGGELVATPPSSPQFCHAYTIGDYHLTCDAVTVHVPETTTPVLRVQTVMYVYNVAINQAADVILEGGGIQFVDQNHAFAYDTVADAWWRVGETDGEMYMDTSPDGASWTRQSTIATPFSLDDIQIALGAGTYEPVATPGRARFHCYNVGAPCM
jgi:hypothetical protein